MYNASVFFCIFRLFSSFLHYRLYQITALTDAGGCRSAERNYSLTCKIICRNKTVNRPCGDTPPDWITDKYGIIFLPIIRRCCCKRNISFTFIIMLSTYTTVVVCPVKVIVRVRFHRRDFKNICPGCVCDRLGYRFRAACRRIIHNKSFCNCRPRYRRSRQFLSD